MRGTLYTTQPIAEEMAPYERLTEQQWPRMGHTHSTDPRAVDFILVCPPEGMPMSGWSVIGLNPCRCLVTPAMDPSPS